MLGIKKKGEKTPDSSDNKMKKWNVMFKKTIPEIWKKKKKAIITVGIFILAAVGGGIFYLRSASAGEVSEGTTTIESATAQTGSIATTVVGSGNIATATAENITIPFDITVNEVLVESGDTVAEGDVLATLDANSILAKMASVQSEIEEIDAELNDLDSDTTETIDTYIAGRVKRIYASQGSNVTDVIRENGALLILSIDGKMAVDIETATAFSVGDDVTVVLSDGSTIDGTVSKSSSSQITVTMTDNGPVLDETVTVNDTSGNTIGTGVLYVNQPVSITGASGTIDSVDVSEGESVSAEETLLTLTDVSVSSEYLELMATRKSLVETLTDLSTLAQDNTIKATFSGTIESVNLTEGEATSSSGSSDSSSSSSPSASAASDTSVAAATISGGTGIILLTTGESGNDADTIPITELTDLKVIAPVKGDPPQIEIEATDKYTGQISWEPSVISTSSFAADTQYTAVIQLEAKAGYEFSSSLNETNIKNNLNIDGIIVRKIEREDDNKTISFRVIFPKTAAEAEEPKETDNNTDTDKSGESETTATSEESSNSGATGSTASTGSSTSTGSSASTGSSSSTGSASTSSSATSDTTDESSSSFETEDAVTAFTIAPDDSVSVSITVDELDILSIEKGQTAAITLDAVDGEFTGEVSSIADTATTSGGVVSYTVDITLPKEDSMKVGMSASATITIEQAENIVTLPASAIQEMGNRVFVYTEMNSETNELSGEVEVETGLSDGNNVEITSGLSEGDTVYYLVITASSDSSTSSEATMIDMGGGMGGSEMQGGGERPSDGGNMPEGGGMGGGQ